MQVDVVYHLPLMLLKRKAGGGEGMNATGDAQVGLPYLVATNPRNNPSEYSCPCSTTHRAASG
jgi:hypothetical protein